MNDRGSAPKASPPIRAAKQIGIRVPVSLSDQLEALARKESNGVSAVVRRLLTVALAASHDTDEAA